MSELLRLEGREFRWDEVLAAHLIDDPPGIQFLLRNPPYTDFVGFQDDHCFELLVELVDRNLLISSAKASLLFKNLMKSLLDKAIKSLFEDPKAAREILDSASAKGSPFHPRLALACVELSGGDLEALRQWCEWARMDYRDVYVAAWYR